MPIFYLQAGPTFSNSAWGKRTRLEKMLFVVVALLVAALAVVLAISIGTSVSQLNRYFQVVI